MKFVIKFLRVFLDNILTVNRYISVVDSINSEAKRVILSIKKDQDSYIYYSGSSVLLKGNLGRLEVTDSINLDLDYQKFIHLISSTDCDLEASLEKDKLSITADSVKADLLCQTI